MIEAGHHLQHRAFDDRTHRKLDRLKGAFAERSVEEGMAEEVEHAGLNLAADDLLLVGDHVHDFERVGVDEAQVEAHIHHIHVRAGGALQCIRRGAAAVGAGAHRTDVEVHFGHAADEVVVGAGDRARENLAIVAAGRAVLRAVAGDQFVVGVFELHLGDRGIEPLDQRNARFRECAHRHQRGALGDFAAGIVRTDLARVVGDLSHRDAHRARAGVLGHAAQGVRIGRLVCDHRRAADRGRITAGDGAGLGRDAAGEGDGCKSEDNRLEKMFASARGHGRGFPFSFKSFSGRSCPLWQSGFRCSSGASSR